MSDLDMEEGLEAVLDELNQTKGVEGAIIVSSVGGVLKHNLKSSGDLALFGPMAQVIGSSSQRLLESAGLGEMEKVLLESKKGKSLFLQLKKVHLIILIKKNANLGMVMMAAQRVSPRIVEITQDMELVEVEPPVPQVTVEETIPEQVTEPAPEETPVKEPITEETPVKPVEETTVEQTKAEVSAEEAMVAEEAETPTEPVEEEAEVEEESKESVEEKPSGGIPSIKPPISLPELPENVIIPDDPQGRANLIIEIYETLFLAMAIGASKIMGVSPARGLTKQFLPSSECKELLEGVDIKSNAVIDFEALRINVEKIEVEDRESVFLRDFSHIIKVITDNYGKVMGYDAFRGMVRFEFRAINDSFGEAIEELGIKERMHPELQKLL
ncbi:MAG: roadblock/LC7 domain-containing protein [Methanobacteriaceae archaeon]